MILTFEYFDIDMKTNITRLRGKERLRKHVLYYEFQPIPDRKASHWGWGRLTNLRRSVDTN